MKQTKLVVITTNKDTMRFTRYIGNKRESAVDLNLATDTTLEGLKFVLEDYRVNGDRAI